MGGGGLQEQGVSGDQQEAGQGAEKNQHVQSSKSVFTPSVFFFFSSLICVVVSHHVLNSTFLSREEKQHHFLIDLGKPQ